ncbi:MAG: DUF1566 domain-containing protein [Bacteroidales bacterium]|nr:DUF1566 domain-containing protein [Bacteroidales bacterium]
MKKIIYVIFAAIACLCSCQKPLEVEKSLGTIECRVYDADYTSVQIRYATNIPEGVSGCMVGVFVTSGEDPMKNEDACEFSGGMQAVESGESEGDVLVEGLKPGTAYKARACIISTVDGRTVWSEMTSFGTPSPLQPSYIAIEAVKIGTTSAVLNAKWEEHGIKIKKVGVIYSKYENKLSFSDSKFVENDGELELFDLEMGTRYYLMPYAVTEIGRFLANTTYIETKTPVAGNAVDLGLSVKWADINIGASDPDDYGDYFAWGETAPKASYNLSTYKYFDSFHPAYTKYVTKDTFGKIDNKSVLESSDDAASALWGGSWRMPTRDEFKELISNCTWTWKTYDSVMGYEVRSNKAGYTDRVIFLPTAGLRGIDGVIYGSEGKYWSSTLETVNNTGAYLLDFSSSSKTTASYYRLNGGSIRPVTK